MNKTQAITIKFYCEGAYPQMKDKGGSDEVWVDMLAGYDHQIMLAAVRQYIASGNEYPPSVASLIKYYNDFRSSVSNIVIDRIIESGVFEDPVGTDPEIANWNREHRRQKMNNFLSLKRDLWPDWFRAEYEKQEMPAITSALSKTNVKLLN